MYVRPTQAHLEDPGQPPADAHAYRAVLDDLIGMGTGIARLLHAQATAAADLTPDSPHKPANQTPAHSTSTNLITIAAAFDRIARAVRRCIALARALDIPARPAKDPAHHRAAARRRILRAVEDAISRKLSAAAGADDTGFDDADFDHAPNTASPTAEALTAELHERLDGPDLDTDITNRPLADIIAELCRDLGIAPPAGPHPWKRRTPADIAALCARAAAPARPAQTAPQPHPHGPLHPGPNTAPHPAPSLHAAPHTPRVPPSPTGNVPDAHPAHHCGAHGPVALQSARHHSNPSTPAWPPARPP